MLSQQYYRKGYDPKFSLTFIFISMQHQLCVFIFLSVFNCVPVECKGGQRNFMFTATQGPWCQEPFISAYQAHKAAQLRQLLWSGPPLSQKVMIHFHDSFSLGISYF